MSAITIKQALQQMLNNSSWKTRYLQSKVRLEWEQIMGATIAKYTEEVKLVEHTLVIKTQIAALKNELFQSKNLIVDKVNDHLGEKWVKEVIIA